MTEEKSNLTPVVEEQTTSASIMFEDEGSKPMPFSPEQQAFLDGENAKPEEKLIFGKYKSMEEAEKAHKALETGFHETKQEDNTSLPSDEQKEGSEDKKDAWEGEKDYMLDKVKEGDFDIKDLGQYEEGSQRYKIQHAINDWQESGEITPELKENFDKIGVTEELLNHYRGLVESKAQSDANAMMDAVGGADKYGEMSKWAEEGLTDAEQTVFNDTMESNNVDAIKSAIQGLAARYEVANKTSQPTSNMIKADAISQSSGGYESQAQMLADMNDPRYTNDEAYRSKVYAKVAKSNF